MARMREKVAVIILICFGVTALLADFIANDHPILGKTDSGELIGVFSKPREKAELSWAIWPPIRYSASTLDLANANYSRPGTPGKNGIHWLGTDQIGRDIAAGLVYGCRFSFLTALGAALLALIIGMCLGVSAGFFGNRGLSARPEAVGLFLILCLIMMYHLSTSYLDPWMHLLLVGLEIGLAFVIIKLNQKEDRIMHIAVDSIVMRFIEMMSSVPGLLLLLAISAMLQSKSAATTALIIGLIRWTRMAQVSRNEVLRLKNESFVQSATALGFGSGRIIVKHILPNLLSPIIVVFVFSIGAFVLLESSLSFLGIGVALEQQTWGSILSEARRQIDAWWLAVFPGMAIFLSIVSINVLGESWKEKVPHARGRLL